MPIIFFFGFYVCMCCLGCFYCFTLPPWCLLMEWAEIPCTFKEACIWNGFIALAPIVFFSSMARAYYRRKKSASTRGQCIDGAADFIE